jgi:hypothetical protein
MEPAPKPNKHYSFDSKTRKYTFFTKDKFGKNLIVDRDVINKIIWNYSDVNGGLTAKQIAFETEGTTEYITHIIRTMKITHDTLPYTLETIEEVPEEVLVEDVLTAKKFSVVNKIERESNRIQSEDAIKWQTIESGSLEPVKEYFKNFKIPLVKPLKSFTKKRNDDDDVWITSISDIHVGSRHFEENVYNNKSNDTYDLHGDLARYAFEIEETVNSRKTKFSKCVLINAGDTLHSISGFTSKGTQLRDGVWGTEQFKMAFEMLSEFITQMYDIFGKVEIKNVYGNHDHIHDHILFYTLEKYFSNYPNIIFDNRETRWLDFQIGKSLFVVEHGCSPLYKAKVPSDGKAREAYCQNIFMNIADKYPGIQNRYFMVGDLHNIELGEYANFEYIRLSSPIRGDQFADQNNLKNRPRFNSFVVDRYQGIKEILHYYV